MALAARDAGYEYLAITDHSASFGFGDEVAPDRLLAQIELIRSTRVDGIELLAGSEVNILPDGSLDYEDELLAELDWVVASVHTAFRTPAAEMTQRIIRAIEHPLVDCIGHLSGRKIERRRPYEFDVERVIDAAAEPMRRIALAAGVLCLAGCGTSGSSPIQHVVVTSSAFGPSGEIPREFTCDGRNISPPLHWSEVPDEATQLMLTMKDPGAP